jgi:hypothetical protein
MTSFTIDQETAMLYKKACRAKKLYNGGRWSEIRTICYYSRLFGSMERACFMFNSYVKAGIGNDKV